MIDVELITSYVSPRTLPPYVWPSLTISHDTTKTQPMHSHSPNSWNMLVYKKSGFIYSHVLKRLDIYSNCHNHYSTLKRMKILQPIDTLVQQENALLWPKLWLVCGLTSSKFLAGGLVVNSAGTSPLAGGSGASDSGVLQNSVGKKNGVSVEKSGSEFTILEFR